MPTSEELSNAATTVIAAAADVSAAANVIQDTIQNAVQGPVGPAGPAGAPGPAGTEPPVILSMNSTTGQVSSGRDFTVETPNPPSWVVNTGASVFRLAPGKYLMRHVAQVTGNFNDPSESSTVVMSPGGGGFSNFIHLGRAPLTENANQNSVESLRLATLSAETNLGVQVNVSGDGTVSFDGYIEITRMGDS